MGKVCFESHPENPTRHPSEISGNSVGLAITWFPMTFQPYKVPEMSNSCDTEISCPMQISTLELEVRICIHI